MGCVRQVALGDLPQVDWAEGFINNLCQCHNRLQPAGCAAACLLLLGPGHNLGGHLFVRGCKGSVWQALAKEEGQDLGSGHL